MTWTESLVPLCKENWEPLRICGAVICERRVPGLQLHAVVKCEMERHRWDPRG